MGGSHESNVVSAVVKDVTGGSQTLGAKMPENMFKLTVSLHCNYGAGPKYVRVTVWYAMRKFHVEG